ncbi:MAG: pyruvate kinase [Desulfobulbaceae bacterium]|jgi:pyruvate kinase|nr:pyruvate kinase [Desulfobulbaceae bacterium]
MPDHLFPCKTKIVCTIGPASDSPEMLEEMLKAGMNIARLNFSHGDFSVHGDVIKRIRAASEKTGLPVAIMADLPGPKIRIGTFAEEPIELAIGDRFTLTTEEIVGNQEIVSVSLKELPQAVKPGDILFLNDGLVQVQAEKIEGCRVHGRVLVGGALRSKKGLNLPGIDLGISAFTEHDRACMKFALEHGVDAVSQSFVNRAEDIVAVRQAAEGMGYEPFIIAKLERSSALDSIDEILQAASGVMVARGDLGVEVPIEEIAMLQKNITARANYFGKPVITATQMLESMTHNRRPTRAESTDVANAILDGTDCVMLSEESAMGDYPLDAVRMLVKIARASESSRIGQEGLQRARRRIAGSFIKELDFIAAGINSILGQTSGIGAILAPTNHGEMARQITKLRLPIWVLAVSPNKKNCRELLFSYGVFPIFEAIHPEDWTQLARNYAARFNLTGHSILQTEGPSDDNPERHHKIELINIGREK